MFGKETASHAACGPAAFQGLRPVDPDREATMQSVIKFRVGDDEKLMLANAAHQAGISISDLLRRAGRAAVAGRIASRPLLADLVSIRRAANRLAALADAPTADPTVMAAAVKSTADDLRAIAARHLSTIK
jgi:uncharacterized protein (DUF1778 family)